MADYGICEAKSKEWRTKDLVKDGDNKQKIEGWKDRKVGIATMQSDILKQ